MAHPGGLPNQVLHNRDRKDIKMTTPLQNGLATMTTAEFRELDLHMRLLIEAGVFSETHPEAWRAFIQSTAEQCYEGIVAMHITGDAQYLIVH
jgi:hypothetical protein